MVKRLKQTLPSLYEQDETAWLEIMSRLTAQKRLEEMDCENLSEYLESMAKRDKREVSSRLTVLLTHLLKWEHQPKQRTNSWRGTILEQKQELAELLESGTLRRHAKEIFAKAYEKAVARAATESGLPRKSFPAECDKTVDELLKAD